MLSSTSRSDSADYDLLYKDHYETDIKEFCNTTDAPGIYICNIAGLIDLLKESNILSVLMCEPRNKDAIACMRSYLDSRPHLPPVFLTRLLALSKLTIRLTPARFGASSLDSYVAKVIPGNTRPMTKMTEITAHNVGSVVARRPVKPQSVQPDKRRRSQRAQRGENTGYVHADVSVGARQGRLVPHDRRGEPM